MDDDLRTVLIDSVTDYAIFALDPAGQITSWNPGAQKVKGYTPDEIIGRHFSCFYTAEDRLAGLPERLLDQATAKGRVEAEGWRVRKDGSRFWASVLISAVHDQSGRLRGFAKITRDLTDRRRAEDTRLRLAQLQEAARVRDEFLASISHEMRTPLATLQLQLELLRKSETPLSPEKAAALIRRLQRSYDRLTGLVDSILEQAKIRAGRVILQPKPIDLAATVAEVVEELKPVAERKGLVLAFANLAGSLTLNTDEQSLRIILANLIGNAVKFTLQGTVTVTVSSKGQEHRVAVQDEGPGIPFEDRQRIFEPFERVEPFENKHTPGFGLGLATSKRLSEALGSRIELESQLDKGSTFTLILCSEGAPAP